MDWQGGASSCNRWGLGHGAPSRSHTSLGAGSSLCPSPRCDLGQMPSPPSALASEPEKWAQALLSHGGGGGGGRGVSLGRPLTGVVFPPPASEGAEAGPVSSGTWRLALTGRRNSAGRGGGVSALGSTSLCLWSWSHRKLQPGSGSPHRPSSPSSPGPRALRSRPEQPVAPARGKQATTPHPRPGAGARDAAFFHPGGRTAGGHRPRWPLREVSAAHSALQQSPAWAEGAGSDGVLGADKPVPSDSWGNRPPPSWLSPSCPWVCPRDASGCFTEPFLLSPTPTWAPGRNSPIPALNPGRLPVTARGSVACRAQV